MTVEKQDKLERIILGDDNIDFAKEAMPFIPNSEVEYVGSPIELISRVEQNDSVNPYTMVISDFSYGPGLPNGLEVFSHLRDNGLAVNARKILWTGEADSEDVIRGASELGIELLDKPQLGAIVGMSVSKAPLKKGGSILVYQPGEDSPIYRALVRVVRVLFPPEKITVGHDLKSELVSGKYGLVLDCTTMLHRSAITHGAVAHDMKYYELKEVPRVVCLRNPCTVVRDISEQFAAHYKNQK